MLGRLCWAVAGVAEQLAKTGHPAGHCGMAGAKVSGRPQPPGQLAQPQQGCRPADQLLVSRRQRSHLAVAGHQRLPQRPRRALVLPQAEVPQVEQRLGPADLAEVDQSAVAAIDLEDRGGVEVAVRQRSARQVPVAFALDQRPQPLELGDGEQPPKRPRPWVGEVGGHELGVGRAGGAKRPGRRLPLDPAEAVDPHAVEHGQVAAGGMGDATGGGLVAATRQGFAGDLAGDQHRATQGLVERLDVDHRRHPHAQGSKVLQQGCVDREVVVLAVGDPRVHHPSRGVDPVHLGGQARRRARHRQLGAKHGSQHRVQRLLVDIWPAFHVPPSCANRPATVVVLAHLDAKRSNRDGPWQACGDQSQLTRNRLRLLCAVKRLW
jgi:hypothetical protein